VVWLLASLSQYFTIPFSPNGTFRIFLEVEFIHALNSPDIKAPETEISVKQRILNEKRAREERYLSHTALNDDISTTKFKAHGERDNSGTTITFGIVV
jgi:hypothetical protein